MKTQIASLLGGALVLIVVAVSFHQDRDWIVSEELAGGQGSPPDPDVEIIQRSIQAKDQVADEVIAGRMTLVEAMVRFRTINASRPVHLRGHLEVSPGRSDEERIGYQVLSYVQINLADRPDRNAIIARLESELQTHLASDRPAALPVTPVGATRTSE